MSEADFAAVAAPRTRVLRPYSGEREFALIGTGLTALAGVSVSLAVLLADSGSIAWTSTNAAMLIVVVVMGNIVGYVSICVWMQATRTRLTAAGYDAPPTWKIWLGWLIPFYAIVAPYQVMRALRERTTSPQAALMLTWWLGWLVYLVCDRAYGAIPTAGPTTYGVLAIGTVALIASYAALVRLIMTISASLQPRNWAQTAASTSTTEPAGA